MKKWINVIAAISIILGCPAATALFSEKAIVVDYVSWSMDRGIRKDRSGKYHWATVLVFICSNQIKSTQIFPSPF